MTVAASPSSRAGSAANMRRSAGQSGIGFHTLADATWICRGPMNNRSASTLTALVADTT
jgi:hypothetical protein